MIANMPIKNSLTEVAVLKELAKAEKGRFLAAVEKTAGKLQSEGTEGMSADDILDRATRLEKASTLISIAADEIFDSTFALLEDPKHKRRGWEEYVGAARTVARPARSGFVLRHLAREIKLDETADNVSSLIHRGIEVLNNVQMSLSDAKKFAEAYSFALKQSEAYEAKEKRLCRKYATLKTWTRKEEVESFVSAAEMAIEGSIEVIIEGPVKLYFMISPEQFLFLLQAISAGNAFELLTAKEDGFRAALDSLLNTQTMVESSPLFKTSRTLLAESLREWLRLWKKEQESIRKELVSEEYARNFVEMFENGTLFSR
jgi:hypothetical protein